MFNLMTTTWDQAEAVLDRAGSRADAANLMRFIAFVETASLDDEPIDTSDLLRYLLEASRSDPSQRDLFEQALHMIDSAAIPAAIQLLKAWLQMSADSQAELVRRRHREFCRDCGCPILFQQEEIHVCSD